MKYVLCLDWLSIYCEFDRDFITYSDKYKVEILPFQTRHFKTIEEVFLGKNRIATITRNPHSNVIKSNALIIKFDNYLLYTPNLYEFINQFLQENKIIFKSISRLDIAKDFHTLNGTPVPQFINQFVSGKILKLGKAQFNVRGTHTMTNNYEYIRFGGQKNADTNFYLYNKTKELEEVKNKPYIKNHWTINGLNYKEKDVWRLEFTFKNLNRTFINIDTGEIEFINDLQIIKSENLNKLYNVSIKKYFQFCENTGLCRKDRMPILELMPYNDERTILKDYTTNIDTTRADKIFIKKLHDTYNELRQTNPLECKDLARVQHEYINRKELMNWAQHKEYLIPYYDASTFVQDRRFTRK